MHAATVSIHLFVFSTCICFIPETLPHRQTKVFHPKYNFAVIYCFKCVGKFVRCVNTKPLTSVHIFGRPITIFRVCIRQVFPLIRSVIFRYLCFYRSYALCHKAEQILTAIPLLRHRNLFRVFSLYFLPVKISCKRFYPFIFIYTNDRHQTFNGSSLFIKISTSGTGNLKSEPISASGVATHQSVIISANIQNLVSPPPRSIPTIVTDGNRYKYSYERNRYHQFILQVPLFRAELCRN